MAFLEIQIQGQETLRFNLSGVLGDGLIQAILDDATAALLGRIRARYLEKVDPDGVPWEPSQAGIDREAGGGPGTGFDTGNLFHSIQEAIGPDGNSRVIGTDVPYAPFFHYGTKHMPPRPFLGIGGDDQQVIDAIVSTRVERAMANLKL